MHTVSISRRRSSSLAALLAACVSCGCWVRPAAGGDKRVGFPQRADEQRSFADCNVTTGKVPGWIDGVLLRQQCGALGSPTKPASGGRLTHMFDCLAMAAGYRVRSGTVQYAASLLHSRPERIWAESGFDPNLERVAWLTGYSAIDNEAYRIYQSKYKDSADFNANGMFWLTRNGADLLAVPQFGNEALKLHVETLKSDKVYDFDRDEWLKNFPSGTQFVNNVAHTAVDKDGNIYSSVLALEPSKVAGESDRIFTANRIVYKIDYKTGNKSILASYAATSQQIDLSLCVYMAQAKMWIYQDRYFKVGYVPSISLTDNYVLVPSTSLFFNPCVLLPQDKRGPPVPQIKTWFAPDASQPAPTSVYVLSKSDGKLVRSYNTDSAVFFLHAINAFENSGTSGSSGKMVFYDALIYTSGPVVLQKYLTVDFLMDLGNSWPAEQKAIRFGLGVDDGRWTMTVLTPNEQAMSVEFPVINPKFGGKQYKYAYFVQQPFSDHSLIVKLNLDAKSSTTWTPPGNDVYLSQPAFVARLDSADAKDEDNGYLLIPAFNSTSKKGLLYFVNAETLKSDDMAVATAPVMSYFGLHSQYFQADAVGLHSSAVSRVVNVGLMLIALIILLIRL